MLWLKVKAISRSILLNNFIKKNNIRLCSSKICDQQVELFDKLEKMPNAEKLLNSFLKEIDNEWYISLGIDEEKLKQDLYKVKYYSWGGDQTNSLDKYLISNYVKNIAEFDELCTKRLSITENAWNYVQTSWYNNWSSYLIEALFKRHKDVISAVGEIKSVDFFLKGFPIDLKVTFFPHQFMNIKIKEKVGKSELAWLKQQARKYCIQVFKDQNKDQQIYTISEQLEVIGKRDIIDELNALRKQIIQETQDFPDELISWLYMNQGAMRFGAENRLFIILIDSDDFSQSWKMKRAFKIIDHVVREYLN